MKRAILGALAAVLLVSCGGGDDDTNGDDGNSVDSGQGVADMVGCTGFSADSEELFVTEGGPCRLDGKSINVYYFAETSSIEDYLEVATGFGGLYLVGPNWLIEAPRATLKELQGEHGGQLSDA